MNVLTRLAAAATITLSTGCSNNVIGNTINTDVLTNGVRDYHQNVISKVLANALDENEPAINAKLRSDIANQGIQAFFSAVKEKDKFASFESEETLSDIKEEQDYLLDYGISIYFNDFLNHYNVSKIQPGSLGHAAGFKVGDSIKTINGVDISSLKHNTLQETIRAIQKEHPDRLVCEVYRMGQGTLSLHIGLKATLGSGPLPTESTDETQQVVSQINEFSDNVTFRYFPSEKIAYTRIYSFYKTSKNENGVEKTKEEALLDQENTGESFAIGLKSMLEHSPTKAIVIDLRGNSGGSVPEANEVISAFVQNQKTVRMENRVNPFLSHQFATSSSFYLPKTADKSIYIIMDRNSASASEIVAQCLRELRGNVFVLGEQSFGKGIFQLPFAMNVPAGVDDQGKELFKEMQVKLSTGEWYSPRGTFIGNPNKPKATDGVIPDRTFKNEHVFVVVEDTVGKDIPENKDVILSASIMYISNQINTVMKYPMEYADVSLQGSLQKPSYISSINARGHLN